MKRDFFILPLTLALFLLPHTILAGKIDPQTRAPENAETKAHDSGPADPIQANVKGLTPAIEQACEGGRDRTVCINTFNANPASKTADLKGLTFMSIHWTKTVAENTANWIDEKMTNPGNGAAVDQGLTDCSEVYDDAVSQLDEALDAFATTTDFKDTIEFLTAAMSDANACLQGLNDQKIIDIMGNNNQEFTKHCATSLKAVLTYEKRINPKAP